MQLSIKSLFIFIFFNSILFISTANADDIVKSKVLYVKYKSYPKVAYTNQKIQTIISANIFNQEDKVFSLSSNFSNGKNIERISQDLVWVKQEDNTYEMNIEYKISTKDFSLPM